jgi:hypothetical protein
MGRQGIQKVKVSYAINIGTKMSPYEYLYGFKPSGGLATLPIDGKLLASLSREEDLNRTLEIPQEQMLEFYNQDTSKTAKMPVFTDEGVEEFHLFECEGSSSDLVVGDLEGFILHEELNDEKKQQKQCCTQTMRMMVEGNHQLRKQQSV